VYVTIISNRTSPQRTPRVKAFLDEFLPRLRRFRGVRAIHHYQRPDHGDDMTIIIWNNEEAAEAYRRSDLRRGAEAFERSREARSVREGRPQSYSLS
jgi:heme-degrading monooxygenase HmoA